MVAGVRTVTVKAECLPNLEGPVLTSLSVIVCHKLLLKQEFEYAYKSDEPSRGD
jgi:hypothetical protein